MPDERSRELERAAAFDPTAAAAAARRRYRASADATGRIELAAALGYRLAGDEVESPPHTRLTSEWHTATRDLMAQALISGEAPAPLLPASADPAAEASPVFHRSWRSAFTRLTEMLHGVDDATVCPALRRWCRHHRSVRAAPASLRDATAPAGQQERGTLAALHHALDVVLSSVHRAQDGVLDLQTFLSGIGLTPFVHPIFHPFFHEVHSVIAVDDPDEPPAIVDVLWPGAMFGQLLVLRSAVVVRAGRSWLAPGAGSSTMYSTQARPERDRDTHDLMVSDFGSSPGWQPRRDYAIDDAFVWNIDGRDDVTNFQSSVVGLTLEERRELVAHRCFVRGPRAGPVNRNVAAPARLHPGSWSLTLDRGELPKMSRVAEEVARGSGWAPLRRVGRA